MLSFVPELQKELKEYAANNPDKSYMSGSYYFFSLDIVRSEGS